MADITTVLEINSRGPGKQVEYITANHSLAKAEGVRTNSVRQSDLDVPDRMSYTVFKGTADASGVILPKLVLIRVEFSALRAASAADIAAAVSLHRDITASDNFDRLISGRNLIVDT
jgi:hypothetical protein